MDQSAKHERNTALAIVRGAADLLSDESDPAIWNEAADLVIQGLDRLGRLDSDEIDLDATDLTDAP
jgi:nitrogen-specific signal transduction histidine kinase